MKLSKRDLLKLLETATSKSSFIFDYLLYEWVDGFAMGSLLGPTLADVTMKKNAYIIVQSTLNQ